MSTDDLLSKKPWFSRAVLNMIDHSLHGRVERAQESERALINHLIIHLLDTEKNNNNFAYKSQLSFYGFCQRNLQHSNSQILQDLWVLYMLSEKRDGYFVEFGACDGSLLSNTKLLEESYGWTGILAEPNPVWQTDLAANRKAEISNLCVAARSHETVDFLSIDNLPELSRVLDIVPDDVHERNGNRDQQTHYRVETISLLDLLDKHNAPKVIDYLSLDTEGSEFEILNAFDYDAYKFRLITVEHAGETSKREKICQLLEENGYHRWLPELTRWDDWYVAS